MIFVLVLSLSCKLYVHSIFCGRITITKEKTKKVKKWDHKLYLKTAKHRVKIFAFWVRYCRLLYFYLTFFYFTSTLVLRYSKMWFFFFFSYILLAPSTAFVKQYSLLLCMIFSYVQFTLIFFSQFTYPVYCVR